MPQPTDPTEVLLKYFRGPLQRPGASSVDVAKFILLNADTSRAKAGGLDNGGNEPSLMGRIFDILSRPNYAVAEAVRNPLDKTAFLEGLSGKKKTTFSDVLQDYGVEDPRIRASVGLALDIGLDPTTYIPGGIIAKGATKAGKAIGIGGRVKTLGGNTNLAQKLLNKGEPAFPESFGLPKAEATIPDVLRRPQEGVDFSFGRNALPPPSPPVGQINLNKLPGQLEMPLEGVPKNLPRIKIADYDLNPPVGQMGDVPVKGQGVFRFPDFNVNKIREASKDSAEDIVQKVADGESEAALRVMPRPDDVKVGTREQKAAEEVLKNWDNSRATAQINKQYPDTLNAKQQVKLFYQSLDKAKRRFKNPNSSKIKNAVLSDAYNIYRTVERGLEAKGLVPRLGTGENVRLSEVIQQAGGAKNAQQVLNEFATEIQEGSSTWQAVQALRASGAIKESSTVKNIVEKIAESHATTKSSGVVSDGFMEQFNRILKKMGKASAQAQGVSPAGINATGQIINQVMRLGQTPAQLAINQNRHAINQIVARGVANPAVNHAVTNALQQNLGKLPAWAVTDNKAVDFLMGRVATWWGQSDLRPMSLNSIGASMATASARGHALDNLFKPFNQSQRFEALRLAQGMGTASTPETQQLALQVTKMMDNLVGQVTGQSVVLRSGVHMDMLNKWIDKYNVGFKFTNGKVTNSLGQQIDYSNGVDWLQSWKSADIKDDPKIFLFKLQQAMEQATREKALFDEIGERFGQRVAGGVYKHTITGYPYIQGYYFTEDIAKQIPRVIKDWSTPTGQFNSPVLKLYDRVLSMWKTGVTIYRPAHHIRNMIGDVYLGWMDGVNSVKPYRLAARVQKSMRGAYDTLEDVDDLVRLGVMQKGYGTPNSNEVLFRNRSGVEFTAEQIGAVAHQKGLLEHARTLEDIIDLGEQSKFKPFGGKVQHAARSASELQNHNARLAHFIDKIMKSKGSNLEEIFEAASRRARKWHPSGLDLTQFERNVLRRIIPFYSWMRKSLPLLLEGMVMNPGKTVIPAKIYDAIQEAQGIETPGRADPFPVDQMFPEWIRAQGVGPIAQGPTGLLGGISDQVPPGYVMGGVGLNPLTELVTQIESPGRTLTSSLTPAAKVPMELMTGQKLFTGEPISGPDARPGAMEQYVGEQIPIYSAFQGIAGVTPFGTETKRANRSNEAGTEAFFNWLTGLGVKGTGPYIRQGQYERMAPLKAERKSKKDAFIKYLNEQLGS